MQYTGIIYKIFSSDFWRLVHCDFPNFLPLTGEITDPHSALSGKNHASGSSASVIFSVAFIIRKPASGTHLAEFTANAPDVPLPEKMSTHGQTHVHPVRDYRDPAWRAVYL